MAEYYRDEINRRQKEDGNRRSVWLLLLDILMSIVSVAVVFLSAIIFLGRFVPPDKFWYFSLAGLIAPIVYVVVLVAFLYWIIRWKWRLATIIGIFVIIGMFHVPLYYKLDFTKQYGEQKFDRNSLSILTFNARNFVDDSGRVAVDSIMKYVNEMRPDIICFQEYPTDAARRSSITDELDGYYFGSNVMNNNSLTSECISKYRITDAHRIESFEGTADGIWMDVRIGDDTVRVINVHLQTTSVTTDDSKYISGHEFILDSTREERLTQIAKRLTANNVERARQAEVIRGMVNDSRYPVILCGDFNDVPVSYTYRTASRGLDDTFSRKGHGYAHTFRGLYNILRIDYILVSPQFETLHYSVSDMDISDHHPVFARLKLTQKDR